MKTRTARICFSVLDVYLIMLKRPNTLFRLVEYVTRSVLQTRCKRPS
jgi:hypothetical protein